METIHHLGHAKKMARFSGHLKKKMQKGGFFFFLSEANRGTFLWNILQITAQIDKYSLYVHVEEKLLMIIHWYSLASKSSEKTILPDISGHTLICVK